MRLLITGGAGFIGSNFVNLLLNQDAIFGKKIEQITILDKFTYAGDIRNLDLSRNSEFVNIIHGDICDAELVKKLIPDHDVIVNFAAESHVDRSIENSLSFIQTNVLGTQVLLESSLELNPEIKFVQISTDEVYGSINIDSWDELQPLAPNSPYSASKASADLLALSYHKTHGLDVMITRCSNNYGKLQHPEKFIPKIITNIICGIEVPIYGDGANRRDWLNVIDHCEAIGKVITFGESGNIYNIGGGTELSNLEVVNYIFDLMNADKKLMKFVSDRKGHDFRYSVNYRKLANLTGYNPRTSFKEGIQDTVDWYTQNEEWWAGKL